MEKSVSKEDEGPDKIPNCCNVFPSNSRASALFAFSADPGKTFFQKKIWDQEQDRNIKELVPIHIAVLIPNERGHISSCPSSPR